MLLLDNLNILIVNSNIESRSKLRDVLRSFLHRVEISYAQNLQDAAKAIKSEKGVDIGFIAFELGQEAISDFIRSVNSLTSKRAPPIIATLKRRGDGATLDITNLYLNGITGFISEPYSSDDILRLLTVCAEIKQKQDLKDKIRKATGLLLEEAKRNIATLVHNEYMQQPDTDITTQRNLGKLHDGLKNLYSQDNDQYADAIVEAFINSKPPEKIERVKKKKTTLREAPHPGKIISDLMKKRGLDYDKIQNNLKMEKEAFEALLDCRIPVDETSSREIARVLGKTSREWLKMQKDYDAYQEQIAAKKP